MLIPSSVVQSLVETLKVQHAALAAVLAKQTDVEAARVQLERDRFAWEQSKEADAKAERAQWLAKEAGDDLPATVSAAVTEMAGNDPALKASLLQFARLRHARGIEPAMIATEITRGTPPGAL